MARDEIEAYFAAASQVLAALHEEGNLHVGKKGGPRW